MFSINKMKSNNIEQLDTELGDIAIHNDSSKIQKCKSSPNQEPTTEEIIRLIQEIERIRYDIKLLDQRATKLVLENLHKK